MADHVVSSFQIVGFVELVIDYAPNVEFSSLMGGYKEAIVRCEGETKGLSVLSD